MCLIVSRRYALKIGEEECFFLLNLRIVDYQAGCKLIDIKSFDRYALVRLYNRFLSHVKIRKTIINKRSWYAFILSVSNEKRKEQTHENISVSPAT